MTLEIHKFIVENQHIRNPLLADLIQTKYGESFTRQHIGRTKTKPLEHNIVQESSENIPRKSSAVPRKKRFDFSIDTLKRLLDANPNHILHDEIEHQYIGNVIINNGKQKKTGGKLRSDLIKLCTFIRDVT